MLLIFLQTVDYSRPKYTAYVSTPGKQQVSILNKTTDNSKEMTHDFAGSPLICIRNKQMQPSILKI